MNDNIPSTFLLYILLLLALFAFSIRWLILIRLALRIARDSVSQKTKKRQVYIGQILLFVSILFGSLWVYIGLSIPFQIIAIMVLTGGLLALFTNKATFKYVDRLAAHAQNHHDAKAKKKQSQ